MSQDNATNATTKQTCVDYKPEFRYVCTDSPLQMFNVSEVRAFDLVWVKQGRHLFCPELLFGFLATLCLIIGVKENFKILRKSTYLLANAITHAKCQKFWATTFGKCKAASQAIVAEQNYHFLVFVCTCSLVDVLALLFVPFLAISELQLRWVYSTAHCQLFAFTANLNERVWPALQLGNCLLCYLAVNHRSVYQKLGNMKMTLIYVLAVLFGGFFLHAFVASHEEAYLRGQHVDYDKISVSSHGCLNRLEKNCTWAPHCVQAGLLFALLATTLAIFPLLLFLSRRAVVVCKRQSKEPIRSENYRKGNVNPTFLKMVFRLVLFYGGGLVLHNAVYWFCVPIGLWDYMKGLQGFVHIMPYALSAIAPLFYARQIRILCDSPFLSDVTNEITEKSNEENRTLIDSVRLPRGEDRVISSREETLQQPIIVNGCKVEALATIV